LREAEALMLVEAPVVPLFHQPSRTLRHPSVKGWHNNLLDLHPLKFVSLE
jgi:ABC-type oligopeptide transport system substrate-binding subunit